jgi:glutaredoxin
MKSVLSLVLIVGLVIAGWINRERISGLWAKTDATADESSSDGDASRAGSQRNAATPHPAREAQAQAMRLYPGLGRANSALNLKFVALYKEAQSTNPGLLARADWPLELADRAATSLGGAPMPRSAVAAGTQTQQVKQVVVYTTSHCPYCKQAKQYLVQKGVKFREVDVETSLEGQEAYRRLGANGVPIIMVGDKKVDGFNASELDRLLL